ncbi:shufflon system plasmid conjugative transfer pilus tip adhesin PilV [Pusillimonas caeni]|uniref:shufflon system plasmid conjugative transfer pilus tip adhesin PilV n=1 Tax=Pusillimonas caeni TaxID=1348472 RepID=UPI000E59BDA9|nr:shufflon system plasmid conjugative transfer pilus tip adhesin PilV [Pusillimonas caeni]
MRLSTRLTEIFFSADKSRRCESGFGLPSMLAALAIIVLLHQGLGPALRQYRATPQVNETASHMDKVALAAAQYVKDNYATLTSSLPLNGAATSIPLSTLISTGYLSPQLTQRNPYGQSYSVRVRYVRQGSGANVRNVLEPMVVTEGGRAIDDGELLRIAGRIPSGGSIRSSSPSVAIGNAGGWEAPLAGFGGSPGAGHLAVGLFYSEAGTVDDYLHRGAVAGRPEVNRMATAIDMNNNAVNNASVVQTGETRLTRVVSQGTACSPAGTVARDSAGNPMSCQGGVWTQSAAMFWVAGQGQRMQFTGANGQAMWLQNINGKFRWVNNGFSSEVASIDQTGTFRASGSIVANGNISTSSSVSASGHITASGNMSAGGTITATGNMTGNRLTAREHLQLNGVVTEGAACSPNGLVARTSVGLLVSCQSGRWSKPGGSSRLVDMASCPARSAPYKSCPASPSGTVCEVREQLYGYNLVCIGATWVAVDTITRCPPSDYCRW